MCTAVNALGTAQVTDTCCELDLLNGSAFTGALAVDELNRRRIIRHSDILDNTQSGALVLIVRSFRIPIYEDGKTFTFTIEIDQVLGNAAAVNVEAIPSFNATTSAGVAQTIQDEIPKQSEIYVIKEDAVPSSSTPGYYVFDSTVFVQDMNDAGLAGQFVPIRLTPSAYPCIGACTDNVGFSIPSVTATEIKNSDGLSAGAIAGISIGAVAGSLLLTYVILNLV